MHTAEWKIPQDKYNHCSTRRFSSAMTFSDTTLIQIQEQLIPSKSLEYVSKKFESELNDRLQRSKESMIVGGWTPQKPIGRNSEKFCNTFLAIDFGGSTIKFALINMPRCEIVLQDGFDITAKYVDYKFFDTMIMRISLKINEYLAGKVQMPKFLVSVTFSFPLNDRLEIITMGKGFEMSSEIINKSVKVIIGSSFARVIPALPEKKFDVEVCDVINDSVAVYLTSKFMSKNESISLILGTGINSCFELSSEKVPPKKRSHNTPNNCNCLINAEAGFLGGDVINFTKFDHHGTGGEQNLPLEDIASGKWMPVTFSNILKEYHITGFDSIQMNGELLVEIAENRFKGKLDPESLALASEISRMLIRRGAFYVVAMIFAVSSFVNGGSNTNDEKAIEVGYVGSFLAHSNYYKSQIALFSQNKMHFQFLHNSNLIGAAVATYLNRCI